MHVKCPYKRNDMVAQDSARAFALLAGDILDTGLAPMFVAAPSYACLWLHQTCDHVLDGCCRLRFRSLDSIRMCLPVVVEPGLLEGSLRFTEFTRCVRKGLQSANRGSSRLQSTRGRVQVLHHLLRRHAAVAADLGVTGLRKRWGSDCASQRARTVRLRRSHNAAGPRQWAGCDRFSQSRSPSLNESLRSRNHVRSPLQNAYEEPHIQES